MNRRSLIMGGPALIAVSQSLNGLARAQRGSVEPVPFSHDRVVREAERLAAHPYSAPARDFPPGFENLTYDQYRAIWFKPEAAIWLNEPTPFRLDLFHRGFMFADKVKIALVEEGRATPISFSPALFEYGHLVQPPVAAHEMEFSGFRARTPINAPDAWQEFVVFQGASYFRALGRNHVYGLSARGLAINTGEPEGEEFPLFRQFWIEKPALESSTLVVHALLDCFSTTGAYRFEIMPGAETVMKVEATLFPRHNMKKVGLAPLTSMFMFNAMNRSGFDDFRSAVHDSDGLLMLTEAGEWIWRPLSNPRKLQISSIQVGRPRGFGLMQRARLAEHYGDLEAKYERRPSLWIEPLGDWGKGFVELVEIPTDQETNDNIVAYWRPKEAVPAEDTRRFAYRMRWTDDVRPPSELLAVSGSHSGLSFDKKRRLFVVDFKAAWDAPVNLTAERLSIEVSASKGQIVNSVVHKRQASSVFRVSFELDPGPESESELRLRLLATGKQASETWLYRWTAR